MGSSFTDRGGMVGANNPNDPELKRQFWQGRPTATKEDDKPIVGDEQWWSSYFDDSLQAAPWAQEEDLTNHPAAEAA